MVVGTDSEKARKLMERLYKPFMLNSFRVIFMDIASAEMAKYAANAMLATRISFMNDIANLCEVIGADVEMVRKGIGSDPRIGIKFLYPGCGYGGSCFPKDVKALIHTAHENNISLKVVEAVESVNNEQKHILFKKIISHFGCKENLKGKTIAIWGLSFKPETDDIREAPALVLIDELLTAGANVKVYDPIAMNEVEHLLGSIIVYSENMYEATNNADALTVVTEWKEFRVPNWGIVSKTMTGNAVFDGRNIYDSAELKDNNLIYYSIGKRTNK